MSAPQLETYYLIPRHQWKLVPHASPDGRSQAPALVRDEVPDDAVVIDTPFAGRSGLQTNNPGFPATAAADGYSAAASYLSVDM